MENARQQKTVDGGRVAGCLTGCQMFIADIFVDVFYCKRVSRRAKIKELHERRNNMYKGIKCRCCCWHWLGLHVNQEPDTVREIKRGRQEKSEDIAGMDDLTDPTTDADATLAAGAAEVEAVVRVLGLLLGPMEDAIIERVLARHATAADSALTSVQQVEKESLSQRAMLKTKKLRQNRQHVESAAVMRTRHSFRSGIHTGRRHPVCLHGHVLI